MRTEFPGILRVQGEGNPSPSKPFPGIEEVRNNFIEVSSKLGGGPERLIYKLRLRTPF